jgi:hypothetical protein
VRSLVDLANKIRQVISDLKLLDEMSGKNYKKAFEYRKEIMRERKVSFWNCIKNNLDK